MHAESEFRELLDDRKVQRDLAKMHPMRGSLDASRSAAPTPSRRRATRVRGARLGGVVDLRSTASRRRGGARFGASSSSKSRSGYAHKAPPAALGESRLRLPVGYVTASSFSPERGHRWSNSRRRPNRACLALSHLQKCEASDKPPWRHQHPVERDRGARRAARSGLHRPALPTARKWVTVLAGLGGSTYPGASPDRLREGATQEVTQPSFGRVDKGRMTPRDPGSCECSIRALVASVPPETRQVIEQDL